LIVLDAAEMNASRATLLADIETMKKKPGGLQKVIDDDFGGYTYSPGLDYLRRFVKGLRLCTSQAPKVSEFSRLEDMLRLTAVLVHRRKEVISGELHLQSIIHDYLKASFPSFTTIVVIQKELKSFKPDCGVTDVNTAAEDDQALIPLLHRAEVGRVVEENGSYPARRPGADEGSSHQGHRLDAVRRPDAPARPAQQARRQAPARRPARPQRHGAWTQPASG
jgi:hypothetical protein